VRARTTVLNVDLVYTLIVAKNLPNSDEQLAFFCNLIYRDLAPKALAS
jgi:hypothetical protein